MERLFSHLPLGSLRFRGIAGSRSCLSLASACSHFDDSACFFFTRGGNLIIVNACAAIVRPQRPVTGGNGRPIQLYGRILADGRLLFSSLGLGFSYRLSQMTDLLLQTMKGIALVYVLKSVSYNKSITHSPLLPFEGYVESLHLQMFKIGLLYMFISIL